MGRLCVASRRCGRRRAWGWRAAAYKILEIINDKTRQKPFSAGKGNVNLLQHSLSHSAKAVDDAFTLNLDLKTFNAVIEFQNGHDIDSLAKHPLFHFSDEIVEKLENEHSSKYERIGFRSHIIVQRNELNFSKLRDYIWNCNHIRSHQLVYHELVKNIESQVLEVTS